ncbi:hypothetical protein SEPCBS57363_005035 [Sporothrix epigloea]|uniref:CENP-V/GFA domain-containing protein n=1 Tax=Sporothrix epigloea TaxID=1892477 RepID=A0ABP0DWH7_9PEZI
MEGVTTNCPLTPADAPLTPLQMAEYRIEDVVVEDPLSSWKIYTIREGTRSGQPKEKHFCGNCGCVLWTVAMQDRGELRLVRTALIEGGQGLQLFPPTEVQFKR